MNRRPLSAFVRRLAACATLAGAPCGPRLARAEAPLLFQVGSRAGYAFGGGFFLGPTLGGALGVVGGDNEGLGLGLTASAFVMIDPGAPTRPTFGGTFLAPAPDAHFHAVTAAVIRPYTPGRTSNAIGDCGGN
jgi:hypothetical protein